MHKDGGPYHDRAYCSAAALIGYARNFADGGTINLTIENVTFKNVTVNAYSEAFAHEIIGQADARTINGESYAGDAEWNSGIVFGVDDIKCAAVKTDVVK